MGREQKEGKRFIGKAFSGWILALSFILSIVVVSPIRSEAAGNTMSSATQVSFGTTFYGRITEDNSKDWYRIDLPISGKLTIRLQAEIWRVKYHLYDSDTESYFSNYITWNETTKISNKTIEIELRAGTYYYLVEQYFKNKGDYNVTFSFEPSGESFVESKSQNDDMRQTANPITFGKEYVGYLATDDELDFYQFTLNKKSIVYLKAAAEMYRVSYEIYDSDGIEIDSGYKTWDETSKIGIYNKTYNLEKGSYYFVVKRWARNCGKYRFTLSTTTGGWKKTNGKWWYEYEDGSYPAGRFATIKGKTYYFNPDGYMATGWKKVNGKWYFLNRSSGVLKTGWLKDGGKWYFLDRSTGVMKTGWLKAGGKWYFLKSNGTMRTGWLKASGKWYYMNSDGVMLTNRSMKIRGKIYHFRSNGVCANP